MRVRPRHAPRGCCFWDALHKLTMRGLGFLGMHPQDVASGYPPPPRGRPTVPLLPLTHQTRSPRREPHWTPHGCNHQRCEEGGCLGQEGGLGRTGELRRSMSGVGGMGKA